MEEYQIYQGFPTEWLGAWESINGNPDLYIFQGYDGNYYLLVYNYDKELERGNFSCYDMNADENGWYIRMGIKCCLLMSESSPYGLHITSWGSYIKC